VQRGLPDQKAPASRPGLRLGQRKVSGWWGSGFDKMLVCTAFRRCKLRRIFTLLDNLSTAGDATSLDGAASACPALTFAGAYLYCLS